MNQKEKIIDCAFELGFHQIGFGAVRRFNELEEILINRPTLEFEPEDVEIRINPMRHFEGGRTFIAVGLGYDLFLNQNIEDDEVKVSSSQYIDYHRVIRDKLNNLLDFVRNELNCEGKVFVDLEGLNDRQVAYESGLGFYGKSGHIISPYLGTNFNIGYLIVDCVLEFEQVKTENCLDCERCVKACPSGAIRGDYTVDSQICLSYITQKKNLSHGESELFGSCIYGCDICQLVCPENVVNLEDKRFIIKIPELMSLSNKKFKRQYGNKDFSWRGYAIIKRNIKLSVKNRDLNI